MPKIIGKSITSISPWVSIVEKKVIFEDESFAPEIYHFVSQNDYVGIFAVTEDEQIALMRQYLCF